MSDGVFVAELRRRVDQMLAGDHHFLTGLLAEITKAPVPEARLNEADELRAFKSWLDYYSPGWMQHFAPAEIEPIRAAWLASAKRSAPSLPEPHDGPFVVRNADGSIKEIVQESPSPQLLPTKDG